MKDTIRLTKDDKVEILDQRKLPFKEHIISTEKSKVVIIKVSL